MAANAKDIKKVCVAQLEAELLREGSIKTPKQGWALFYRYLSCFVAVAKQVDNITLELYGNGTPGGLKQDVAILLEKVTTLTELVRSTDDKGGTRPTYGRRSSDLPQQLPVDRDSFAQVIRWFVDKVLPAVIIAVVFGLFNHFLVGK